MKNNRKGFTLMEVLVAVLIFVIGILSIAALGALNFMYINANQAKARLHVFTMSSLENTQSWFREPTNTPGPTQFDDVWAAGHGMGDILKVYTSGNNMQTAVVFDSIHGTSPSAADSRIYVRLSSVYSYKGKQLTETLHFCVSNYGVGD